MSGEKRPLSETGPSADPGSGPFCPKCRARTDRDEGFCARCGARLGSTVEGPIRCPFCKEEVRDRPPKCRRCGCDLTPIWSGEALCSRCGAPLEYGSVPLTSRDLYGVLIVATMTAAVAFWLSPHMGMEQAFGFIVVPVYFILAVVTLKLRFDQKRFHCPRCGWVHRGSWDTRPWILVGILLAILLILLILLLLER